MSLLSLVYPFMLFGLLAAVIVLTVRRRTPTRTIMIVLAVTLLAYVLVIVVPFFAYGLHLQDFDAVRRGAFDPKGYPLFSGAFADGLLHVIALVIIPLAPVVGLLAGMRLINETRANWTRMQPGVRAMTAIVVVMGFVLIGFMFTPLGYTISVWHFD